MTALILNLCAALDLTHEQFFQLCQTNLDLQLERTDRGELAIVPPIDKHGFDFADAYRIFDLPMAVELDERDDYGEDRWIGTGMLDGRVVVVVYTEPDGNIIRITRFAISLF